MCISAVLIAVLLGATGEESAIFDAAQIRAKLDETQKLIESIYVEYESEPRGDNERHSGLYLHRIVAAKAPYSIFHVGAKGRKPEFDWHDDPLQQWAYLDEKRLFNEHRLQRAVVEYPLNPNVDSPGNLAKEFFFLATGIWPISGWQAPRPIGVAYVLSEVAQSSDFSSVGPYQELVNGRRCHVLQNPGLDSLWLDMEAGATLLKRETRSRRGERTVQRYELSDHRELFPGVWIPFTIRNIHLDQDPTASASEERITHDTGIKLLVAEVNQAKDSLFHFDARPGTLALDTGRPPEQRWGGGIDHLDDLADWIRRHATVTELDGGAKSSSDSCMWVFYALMGTVIGDICLIVRKWIAKA